MRGTNFGPGDTVVHRFSFSGVDTRTKLRRLDTFENLMKPYVTVQAEVSDNEDILNRVLGGKTEMRVSFGQPGMEPWSGTFTVSGIEKGKTMDNLRRSVYTVTGVSRHMLRAPQVQKAYRELTGTDILRDLIGGFLSPDKILLVRAASRGLFGNQHMPYNVNGLSIHKAIRAVMERCVSSRDVSSAYVFFEDNRSMVVDTLENMLNGASASYTYFQRPMGQSFLRDQVLQNFVIINFQEESRTDRSNETFVERQETNSLDLFSGTILKDRIGQGLQSTINNLIYNCFRPATHLKDAMAARRRVTNDFDSQSMTLEVHLNTGLTVGRGFGVEISAPLGDTSTRVRDSSSGTYLATEVRHTVDMGRKRAQGITTVRGTLGGRRS